MKTGKPRLCQPVSGCTGAAGAFALVLLFAVLCPAAAHADETADFLAASAEAYKPYRGALAYLRTGNTGLAALALDDAAERWDRLCERYRERPPAAFAADPAWQDSLDDITRRMEAARARAAADDAKGAAELLKPIRASLGSLRRRNGIVTFSDHVDAFSAAMRALWVYRHDPPDMSDDETIARLRQLARALKRAWETLDDEVPAAIANDPQLRRLLEGSAAGIETLERAIESRNQRFLVNTLRELRSFEQMIWLNFG